MPEIAADLVAWRELGKASTIDVSELAAALRAKMEREIAALRTYSSSGANWHTRPCGGCKGCAGH